MPTSSISAWSHLPNAVHIDRILGSIKSHPAQWYAAWEAIMCTVWDDARKNSMDEARNNVRKGGRLVAWNAAWDVAWAARDALLCLVAYDDCAYMLDSEVGELKILAALGDEKAILLLPACFALHLIKELG